MVPVSGRFILEQGFLVLVKHMAWLFTAPTKFLFSPPMYSNFNKSPVPALILGGKPAPPVFLTYC